MRGRSFHAEDPIVEGDTAQGIVISHALWQSHFGGAPDVIGKPLPGWNAAWGRMVIGVMPPGYWIHPSMSEAEAWFAFDYQRMDGRAPTVARLKPGVGVDQAQANLAAAAQRLDADSTGAGRGESWRVQVVPLQEVFTAGYANTVYLLLGAVSFVLLIAAVNVTNLQLCRGFGARNADILRLVAREGLLLILAGLVIGLAVSLGLTPLIANQLYGVTPMDPLTITAVSIVLGCVAFLASFLPARRAIRIDPQTALRVE